MTKKRTMKKVKLYSLLCPKCTGFLDCSIQSYTEITKQIFCSKSRQISFGKVVETEDYTTYALVCVNPHCDFQKYCETTANIREFLAKGGDGDHWQFSSDRELKPAVQPDFAASLVRRTQL